MLVQVSSDASAAAAQTSAEITAESKQKLPERYQDFRAICRRIGDSTSDLKPAEKISELVRVVDAIDQDIKQKTLTREHLPTQMPAATSGEKAITIKQFLHEELPQTFLTLCRAFHNTIQSKLLGNLIEDRAGKNTSVCYLIGNLFDENEREPFFTEANKVVGAWHVTEKGYIPAYTAKVKSITGRLSKQLELDRESKLDLTKLQSRQNLSHDLAVALSGLYEDFYQKYYPYVLTCGAEASVIKPWIEILAKRIPQLVVQLVQARVQYDMHNPEFATIFINCCELYAHAFAFEGNIQFHARGIRSEITASNLATALESYEQAFSQIMPLITGIEYLASVNKIPSPGKPLAYALYSTVIAVLLPVCKQFNYIDLVRVAKAQGESQTELLRRAEYINQLFGERLKRICAVTLAHVSDKMKTLLNHATLFPPVVPVVTVASAAETKEQQKEKTAASVIDVAKEQKAAAVADVKKGEWIQRYRVQVIDVLKGEVLAPPPVTDADTDSSSETKLSKPEKRKEIRTILGRAGIGILARLSALYDKMSPSTFILGTEPDAVRGIVTTLRYDLPQFAAKLLIATCQEDKGQKDFATMLSDSARIYSQSVDFERRLLKDEEIKPVKITKENVQIAIGQYEQAMRKILPLIEAASKLGESIEGQKILAQTLLEIVRTCLEPICRKYDRTCIGKVEGLRGTFSSRSDAINSFFNRDFSQICILLAPSNGDVQGKILQNTVYFPEAVAAAVAAPASDASAPTAHSRPVAPVASHAVHAVGHFSGTTVKMHPRISQPAVVPGSQTTGDAATAKASVPTPSASPSSPPA